MTRHWKRRRRLLWAGLLLCLVVIVAVLSVADAGLRIYDHVYAATRDRRAKPKPFGTSPALRRVWPA